MRKFWWKQQFSYTVHTLNLNLWYYANFRIIFFLLDICVYFNKHFKGCPFGPKSFTAKRTKLVNNIESRPTLLYTTLAGKMAIQAVKQHGRHCPHGLSAIQPDWCSRPSLYQHIFSHFRIRRGGTHGPVGWRDLAICSNFRNGTHCCRSGTFFFSFISK